MMRIEFKPLCDVDPSEIIALMNHPLVRRHLPLAPAHFGMIECRAFLVEKARMWSENGIGPWAIVDEGQLIGWGGLQPDEGEVDLALVLHPRGWGTGRSILARFIAEAFSEKGLSEVTLLLPPSRTRLRALSRLGFEEYGRRTIGSQAFIRYRLRAEQYEATPASPAWVAPPARCPCHAIGMRLHRDA